MTSFRDLSSSVGDLLSRSRRCRPSDRVALLGAAITVIERCAERCQRMPPRNRAQQMQILECERVAPPDDMAGRPPVTMLERALEAARVPNEQLVHPFLIERKRPARAVDLPRVMIDSSGCD